MFWEKRNSLTTKSATGPADLPRSIALRVAPQKVASDIASYLSSSAPDVPQRLRLITQNPRMRVTGNGPHMRTLFAAVQGFQSLTPMTCEEMATGP